MRTLAHLAVVLLAVAALGAPAPAWQPARLPQRPAVVAKVIQVETSQGAFSIQTFPIEAPVTVAHIIALVRAGFYDGQRVHRALPRFLVQFGDPQSKDLAKRPVWGRGAAASSGTPIGLAEINAKRNHRKGAVGLAHMGSPAKADSQIYITLDTRSDLDGRYTVFGQVVSGADVPERLAVGDVIMKMSVPD